MDIFEGYGIKILVQHLESYVETLPPLRSSRLHLSRIQTMEDMIPVTVNENVSEFDRDSVKQYIETFYRLTKDPNPFTYFSKLKFVLDYEDDQEFWSKTLFFRLISDRCLYFYDRREFATTAKSCGLYGLVLKYRKIPNAEDIVKCIEAGVEHVSSLHLEYLKENQSTFQTLTQAIRLKEQNLSISSMLLKEINKLGNECKKTIDTNAIASIENNTSYNTQKEQIFTKIIELIKIYVASVIWKTRKKDYIPLFEDLFLTKTKKAVSDFHNLVYQILNTLTKDGDYHPYSPLVLYHIITSNTKAVLQGNVAGIWDNLTSNSKSAKIDSMTSLTGRKAAINLVLYQKLCQIFIVNKNLCTIDGLPSTIKVPCASCKKDPTIKPAIPDGCIFESNHTETACPYGVRLENLMKFMFALITGYGHLFHHFSMEPTCFIPASSLMISKRKFAKESFKVFSYRPDYRYPVDDCEFQIKANINACFANRPEFLTLLVPKRSGRIGAASLSHLLLQDMAMPARQRISRFILKSMNQDILEKYRPYLYYPYERSVVLSCLDDIIQTHFNGIENFMVRYHDFGTKSFEYNYQDALRALVEYEIRHLLYEEGKQALSLIAQQVLPKHLYTGKTLVHKKNSGKSGRKFENSPDFPDSEEA